VSTAPAGVAQAAAQRVASLPVRALPNSQETVAGLLNRLPTSLGGRTRQPVNGTVVTYTAAGQSSITLTVESLADAAGPNVAMADFFHRFVTSGQIKAKAQGTAPLFYVTGQTADSQLPAAAWARADGDWLYAVEGDSWPTVGALLDALRHALG
jgi:hypothetical protein